MISAALRPAAVTTNVWGDPFLADAADKRPERVVSEVKCFKNSGRLLSVLSWRQSLVSLRACAIASTLLSSI